MIFAKKKTPSLILGLLSVATLALAMTLGGCAAGDTTVRMISKTVSVTPTVSAASAYTANDAVGGEMTFAGATANRSQTAVLSTVTIIDEGDQGAALNLVCANQTVTEGADNAAFAWSDADVLNAVITVAIAATDYVDVGGAKVAVVGNVGQLFTTYNGDSLYCQLQTTGTPTYAATDDITVKLGFLQD